MDFATELSAFITNRRVVVALIVLFVFIGLQLSRSFGSGNTSKFFSLIIPTFAIILVMTFGLSGKEYQKESRNKLEVNEELIKDRRDFKVLASNWIIISNALIDEEISEREYDAFKDVGKVMGVDYTDLLGRLELVGDDSSYYELEGRLGDVYDVMVNEHVGGMRTFLLSDGLDDLRKFYEKYGMQSMSSYHKELTYMLAMFDVEYEKGLMKNSLDDVELDAYLDRMTDVLNNKSEDELLDVYVLRKSKDIMEDAWDDRDFDSAEIALFEMFDDVNGTRVSRLVDDLKKNPDSTVMLKKYEEMIDENFRNK